jgi:hypothetical protein
MKAHERLKRISEPDAQTTHSKSVLCPEMHKGWLGENEKREGTRQTAGEIPVSRG